MKKDQSLDTGFNFGPQSLNSLSGSFNFSEFGMNSQTNSLMTLYHSSPCLKKVLSEQFLNQLKCKTEVDSIRQQMQILQEK